MTLFFLLSCGSPEFNLGKINIPESQGDTSENLPPEETNVPDTGPPPECPDRVWASVETAIDETCFLPPDTGTFTPFIEWEMFSYAEYPDHHFTWSTPLTGHFNDDNGDGLNGLGDIPDIVVIQFTDDHPAGKGQNYIENPNGVLRLISGDGTSVHWSAHATLYEGFPYSPFNLSTPALGDIDADGTADIVALVHHEDDCFAAAYDHLGQLKWVNTEATHSCSWIEPSIADIDADGFPEVLFGRHVYNGEDGSLQWEGDYGRGGRGGEAGYQSFAVDLDLDGQQEVIAGSSIYNSDGSNRCFNGISDGSTAVADVDGDGKGEIVLTGNGQVMIFEDNCWLKTSWPLVDGGKGGHATIADYDGDGEPEIGVASKIYYYVFEVDGTLLWLNAVDDSSSNCTGSSVYDFEGDGYSEVVYADENDLWVFNGLDGAQRLKEPTHSSLTAHEYPITVDVDGDGQVEIVVPDDQGIYVVGDYDQSWVPAREIWNQHAYSITNINDDMSIPTHPESNWPIYNNFRSGDIQENYGQGSNLGDAIPLLVDTCELECDQGLLQLVIQVGNSGLSDLPASIPVSLYAEVGGARQHLQTLYTEAFVVSGRSTPGIAVNLDPAEVPEGRIWVVVDDDGAGGSILDECREDNNEILISEGLCQ